MAVFVMSVLPAVVIQKHTAELNGSFYGALETKVKSQCICVRAENSSLPPF